VKSIYFAHPIKTYATPQALKIRKALKQEYPGYQIVDPEDLNPPEPWTSCRQCMDKHMGKIFFPAIEQCEKFAIWAPIITCGIECELHKAWELGKELIYISHQFGEVDLENTTLKELHYIREVTEVN